MLTCHAQNPQLISSNKTTINVILNCYRPQFLMYTFWVLLLGRGKSLEGKKKCRIETKPKEMVTTLNCTKHVNCMISMYRFFSVCVFTVRYIYQIYISDTYFIYISDIYQKYISDSGKCLKNLEILFSASFSTSY